MSKLLGKAIGLQLARYIKNYSKDKFSLKAIQGKVELKNIELNERRIQNLLPLPPRLQVTRVFCARLLINVPWGHMKTRPVHIVIDTMDLGLAEVTDHEEKAMKTWMKNLKTERRTLADEFFENAKVEISSISVAIHTLRHDPSNPRFAENVSFGREMIFSVRIGNVKLQATDEEWNETTLAKVRAKFRKKSVVELHRDISLESVFSCLHVIAREGEDVDSMQTINLNGVEKRVRKTIDLLQPSPVQLLLTTKRKKSGPIIAEEFKVVFGSLLFSLTVADWLFLLSYINSLRFCLEKTLLEGEGADSTEKGGKAVDASRKRGGKKSQSEPSSSVASPSNSRHGSVALGDEFGEAFGIEERQLREELEALGIHDDEDCADDESTTADASVDGDVLDETEAISRASEKEHKETLLSLHCDSVGLTLVGEHEGHELQFMVVGVDGSVSRMLCTAVRDEVQIFYSKLSVAASIGLFTLQSSLRDEMSTRRGLRDSHEVYLIKPELEEGTSKSALVFKGITHVPVAPFTSLPSRIPRAGIEASVSPLKFRVDLDAFGILRSFGEAAMALSDPNTTLDEVGSWTVRCAVHLGAIEVVIPVDMLQLAPLPNSSPLYSVRMASFSFLSDGESMSSIDSLGEHSAFCSFVRAAEERHKGVPDNLYSLRCDSVSCEHLRVGDALFQMDPVLAPTSFRAFFAVSKREGEFLESLMIDILGTFGEVVVSSEYLNVVKAVVDFLERGKGLQARPPLESIKELEPTPVAESSDGEETSSDIAKGDLPIPLFSLDLQMSKLSISHTPRPPAFSVNVIHATHTTVVSAAERLSLRGTNDGTKVTFSASARVNSMLVHAPLLIPHAFAISSSSDPAQLEANASIMTKRAERAISFQGKVAECSAALVLLPDTAKRERESTYSSSTGVVSETTQEAEPASSQDTAGDNDADDQVTGLPPNLAVDARLESVQMEIYELTKCVDMSRPPQNNPTVLQLARWCIPLDEEGRKMLELRGNFLFAHEPIEVPVVVSDLNARLAATTLHHSHKLKELKGAMKSATEKFEQEKSSLVEELIATKLSLAQSETKVDRVCSQLRERDSELRSVKEDREEIRRRYKSDMKTMAETLGANHFRSKTGVQQQKRKLSQKEKDLLLQEEIARHRERIAREAEMDKERATLNAAREELAQKLDGAVVENAALIERVQSKEKMVDDLSANLSECRTSLEEVRARADKTEGKLVEAERRLVVASSELAEAQRTFEKDRGALVSSHEIRIKIVEERAQELQMKVGEYARERDSAELICRELNDKIANQGVALAESQLRAETLARALEESVKRKKKDPQLEHAKRMAKEEARAPPPKPPKPEMEELHRVIYQDSIQIEDASFAEYKGDESISLEHNSIHGPRLGKGLARRVKNARSAAHHRVKDARTKRKTKKAGEEDESDSDGSQGEEVADTDDQPSVVVRDDPPLIEL